MTTTPQGVNFYEILSLSETANKEEIKKAIREQRRIWSKRAGQADPVKRSLAEERIRQLADAERVLLEPSRRRQFDQDVRNRQVTTAASPAASNGHRDWLAEARSYYEQGDAASANYAAREALAVNGANHEAWSIRANSSFLLGRYHDAEFEFKEAIRLQPENADHHFDLAEAYAEGGQWRSALGEYETALRLDPGNPIYRTAIAQVYIHDEQPERALQLMEAVVKEYPNERVFQYYLAMALHDTAVTRHSWINGDRWAITSPAQIRSTKQLTQKALSLKFDDSGLRDSLRFLLNKAHEAEQVKWFHANVKRYAVALFIGIIYLFYGFSESAGAVFFGLLIIGGTVALYAWRHHMYQWQYADKHLPIARRGI